MKATKPSEAIDKAQQNLLAPEPLEELSIDEARAQPRNLTTSSLRESDE